MAHLPTTASLKRKQSVDHDSPMPSSGPPSPSGSHSSDSNDHAQVKRVRTSAELVSKKRAVSKLIATMSMPQLVNLINTLVESHPSLAEEIAVLAPRPTLSSVESLLRSLEQKLDSAFPYNRLGRGQDDYSFNRVKPVLEEFVETIVDYTNHFTSPSEFPTTSFAFLHTASEFCHRLPNWTTAANNEIKRELYRKLDEFWIKAIHEASSKLGEGKVYAQLTVQEWAKNLQHHNIQSENRFANAIEEFKTHLGWIINK
ncbi:Tethering factor for nuclear proteasome sts1 [Actinomortierella wolfii]|nr:Tethering factor for nuclear proteasome sts1 [Actinomortierella wolfii]